MQTPTQASLQRITFTAERQVSCETVALPEVGPRAVLVRARWSLLSTGTETIVFGRRFAPGTHWDQWVKYPFYPGYALVGEVVHCGSDVTTLAVGDWVATRSPHASMVVVEAAACQRLPAHLNPRDATWFALAKIAAMGARAAAFALGDQVLVIGAGPIGQMSQRWALAAGAERVVVLDPQAWRLRLASHGGASAVLAMPLTTAGQAVREAFDGQLPGLVIDATGHSEVLSQALPLVRTQGTLLIIGDTGRPAEQHLSSDVLTRGLHIVGAHDGNETADWNSQRIIPLFFRLVASGRFPVEGLITHVFPAQRCAEAYDLADSRRGETMGILFDWQP